MRTLLGIVVAIGFAAGVVVWSLGHGAFGRFDSETLSPVTAPRPSAAVDAGVAMQRAAADRFCSATCTHTPRSLSTRSC